VLFIESNDEAYAYFGRTPSSNTLFYLNLDQTDWVFTEYKWHSTNNNWVVYNSNGIKNWCCFNNISWKRVQSLFNTWESFPTQFTMMCFMKPAWNHLVSDHPMGIVLSDQPNQRALWIWFTQNNSQVQFNYLQEWVKWNERNITISWLVNTRRHFALTYDWSTMIWYIDWVQQFTYNISWVWSWSDSPVNWLTICWRETTSWTYTSTFNWYVDEVIVENVIRNSTDINDYLVKIWFKNA
jgi:hypothetical protein